MWPPTLLTPRLCLRPYCHADEQAFVALFGDPRVTRFMSAPGERAAIVALFDRALQRYESVGGKRHEIWAITARDHPALILGHAELNQTVHTEEGQLEMIYALAPGAWGQGYGSEVARALVAHGLGSGATAIVATVDSDNQPSIRVLEKAGLRYQRTLHPADEEPYLLYLTEQTS